MYVEKAGGAHQSVEEMREAEGRKSRLLPIIINPSVIQSRWKKRIHCGALVRPFGEDDGSSPRPHSPRKSLPTTISKPFGRQTRELAYEPPRPCNIKRSERMPFISIPATETKSNSRPSPAKLNLVSVGYNSREFFTTKQTVIVNLMPVCLSVRLPFVYLLVCLFI